MELWEYNAIVSGHNDRLRREARENFASCWQTANFAGAAFVGKLRSLHHYLPDEEQPAQTGATVTAEQMAALDARFESARKEAVNVSV